MIPDLSLIDLLVLLGVALILPLAIGGRWIWWPAAATSAGIAMTQPRGFSAAVLAMPWVVTAAASVIGRLRVAGPGHEWGLHDSIDVLARAYAVVAAAAFMQSSAGARLFGVGEPIVELTAAHFTYAGAAALVLAERARRSRPGEARPRLGMAAVVLTAAAPPIVAFGFVTSSPLPQIGGAVCMTLGVWSTATMELMSASAAIESVPVRVALFVSGVAIWIPMAVAVAWAAGQHWDTPALSVPDMARTHGVANALGFTLCGLLGRERVACA